jgi:hypothetical protein
MVVKNEKRVCGDRRVRESGRPMAGASVASVERRRLEVDEIPFSNGWPIGRFACRAKPKSNCEIETEKASPLGEAFFLWAAGGYFSRS